MIGCMRHVGGALALALTLVSALPAQQQQAGGQQPQRQENTGTIEGQVLLAGSQRPLGGAQVFVVGGQIGALTNSDGRYVISGVPRARARCASSPSATATSSARSWSRLRRPAP